MYNDQSFLCLFLALCTVSHMVVPCSKNKFVLLWYAPLLFRALAKSSSDGDSVHGWSKLRWHLVKQVFYQNAESKLYPFRIFSRWPSWFISSSPGSRRFSTLPELLSSIPTPWYPQTYIPWVRIPYSFTISSFNWAWKSRSPVFYYEYLFFKFFKVDTLIFSAPAGDHAKKKLKSAIFVFVFSFFNLQTSAYHGDQEGGPPRSGETIETITGIYWDPLQVYHIYISCNVCKETMKM